MAPAEAILALDPLDWNSSWECRRGGIVKSAAVLASEEDLEGSSEGSRLRNGRLREAFALKGLGNGPSDLGHVVGSCGRVQALAGVMSEGQGQVATRPCVLLFPWGDHLCLTAPLV